MTHTDNQESRDALRAERAMSRYKRDRQLRQFLQAHKYPERNSGDDMVGIGCLVIVILAAMGVL